LAEIHYLDFDLRIERAEEGYIARVLDCPAGEASAAFAPPFSELELENFSLRVGRTRRGVRRLESPEMEAAKVFGGQLFEAVFQGDVRGCFDSSLEIVRRQGAGLRLRLRLEAPEMADVPWEYLYNPALNRFLSLSVETPLVRYLALPERIQPLPVTPPLRVLVMIASPSDYPALEVEREWEKLRESVAELESGGRVVLERLERATLSALQQRLRRGGYHIFHFIGHGAFDERAQDGVLLLEDEEGRGRAVSGQNVGTMLHDERTLRLAILNACEGARTSASDPFAGTAQSLVQQGIPAVIAMQFEITDEAAITLAHEFYGALADGYPVDAALAEARKAIFAQGNDVEWGTPVLYLRTPDGRIFDVAQVGEEERELAALYARGREHYEAGRYQEALTCFRQVRDLREDYQEVNALIAAVEEALAEDQRQEQMVAAPRPVPVSAWSGNRLWMGIAAVLAALLLIGGGAFVVRELIGGGTPTPTLTFTPSPSPAATLTDTPTPEPGALVLEEWSVFPTQVIPGQPVVIKWRVSNADSVVLEPFGPVDSSGEHEDEPQQTTTYTLIATSAGGTLEESLEVVVVALPPGAPDIKSFDVEPDTLVRGQVATVRLSWDTEGADTVTIEPDLGPVGLAGSREVAAPAADTVYALVARSPGGEARAQVQVRVQDPRCTVVSEGLNLRSGPGTVYEPPVTSLSQGTELQPLAYISRGYPEGPWLLVRVVATGTQGWASARTQYVDCNLDVTTLPSGTVPPTPTPPRLPDLTVEIVGIDNTTIVHGEQPWTWIHYRVSNTGNEATPGGPIYLRIWKNGSPASGYMVVDGPIQPGDAATGKFAVGHSSDWPVGSYTVRVEVDYLDDIEESDEGNNLSDSVSFEVVPSEASGSARIDFDALPDGTPITTARILEGDEFLSQGIRLAGAPESSYCADATAAAIRPPGAYSGITFNVLTTARPDDTRACNTIPVAIIFSDPVRRVTLTFAGATATYTLKAYDSTGGLLGAVDREAVLGAGTFEVTFDSGSANIHRVTFGHETAVTAVKEVYYER
jgi:uncharacterized protein YraI